MVNTKFKKTEKKNQLLFFFFHKKFLKIFHKPIFLEHPLTFPYNKYIPSSHIVKSDKIQHNTIHTTDSFNKHVVFVSNARNLSNPFKLILFYQYTLQNYRDINIFSFQVAFSQATTDSFNKHIVFVSNSRNLSNPFNLILFYQYTLQNYRDINLFSFQVAFSQALWPPLILKPQSHLIF